MNTELRDNVSKLMGNLTKGKNIFLLSGLLVMAQVVAHEGATGIVKERMDMMSDMKDAAKIIGNMVKGKIPMDATEVSRLAADIRAHAIKIPEMFPDTELSRESHATEAMPAVWSRWDEFESLSIKLSEQSTELEAAAAGGPRVVRGDEDLFNW